MFLPIDPEKMSAIWASFSESLRETEHCFVVLDGRNNNPAAGRRLTSAEAEGVVQRMKLLNYVRIGTSKLNPVPPHFGLHVDGERRRADLVEYFGLDCSADRIFRDLTLCVELAFFEIPFLEELAIPLACDEILVPGLLGRKGSDPGSTLFVRKL